MNYENIYNKLQDQGYYIGTFDDFWHDDHDGITKKDFDDAAEFFKSTEKNIEKEFTYRHNYINQKNGTFLENPNYTGPIPTEEDIKEIIPYSSRNTRKKFIEDAIAGGADIRTTQQWALAGFQNGAKMEKTFNTFTKSFVSKVYKFLEKDKEQLILAPQYSVYKKDDFSELHYDGVRKTRACAIIYYFADPSTWNNSGGRLVITKTNEFSYLLNDNPKLLEEWTAQNNPVIDTVIPTYGNYAMLDLMKHNCGHAIERVIDDNFTRFSLITFIGLPGME